MPELILKNVTKIFPLPPVKRSLFRKKASVPVAGGNVTPEGIAAIRDFSLEIEKGELIVLLGASGSGKSTLLRLIAGLEQPDSGEILLDGENINDVIPEDREAAMVFQNYSLYPHLTVFDNIAFPLHAAHMPREQVKEKVDKIARLLELENILAQYPKNLSGGQKQRVAVGRALIRSPRFLLMDEPFANLDAPLRGTLRATVKRLHSQLGNTVIYVTHDPMEAISLATRIVVLQDGQIRQVGTPQQIYYRPENRYVASLVGEPPMNFLPARLERSGEQWQVAIGDMKLCLPPKKWNHLPPADCGRQVILGVRPVHIFRSGEGLQGKVIYTEQIRNELRICLDTDCGSLITVTEQEGFGTQLLRGAEMTVSFDPERVILFDSKTGNALFL